MSFGRVVEVIVQAEGQAAVLITDLRIRFNAKKTSQTQANEIDIEIYNLSRATFDRISAVDNLVILKAGYSDEGGAKIVATGTITKALYIHEGSQTRAEITCLDGQKESRALPVSLSYIPGTPVATVVTAILAAIPMPIGKLAVIPSDAYISGYSFVGKAFDALAEVLNRVNLYYTIQNNSIYILAEDETIEVTAVLISPETGLLESPKPKATLNGIGSASVEGKQYSVLSLLNPILLPGSYIQLQSRNTEGFFKITTIEQKGDSWQGSFESDMEVTEV